MGSLYFRSSDFDSLPKSNCNLSNQVPSQQSDCNLSNPYAISNNRLQSPQSDCNTGGLQSDCWYCSLILEVSQNQRTSNRGFPLVEGQKSRPLIGWKDRIKKIQGISLSFRNLSHSTHSRWQSPQSDCNLYNQTAICIIRLQSPQFDSNLYNQTAISRNRLQKFSNLHIQSVNPTASQSGWVPHLSAFSTIRL